jgi:hypothetical protein
MTLSDTETLQRAVLAEAIDRNRDSIEKRWLSTILAALGDKNVSPTEFRDAMPDYLRELVAALRDRDGMEQVASAAWSTIAREHAVTRVRLGFDIDELVHEFIVLRRVLFEVMLEEGVLDDVRQAARLTDLTEAGLAVAVRSYVESRDYDARRKEAEHVGFITHELRNPLTTATLAAGHWRHTLPPQIPVPRQLVVLERALGRMGTLIDSVLAVERLEAGAAQPHYEDLPLGTVIEHCLSVGMAAAQAKGLQFEVSVPAEVVVHVDPALTSSAMFNLVENAVKYTDVGRVRVDGEERSEQVVIHVRDNCAGLSREELRTIFEPFRRGHTGKPGTGLGLAIARRSVEAEGGTLCVESNEERGCHFWVTLQRALGVQKGRWSDEGSSR